MDTTVNDVLLPTLTPEQIANLKAWIAALRSGAFKQGQEALRRAGAGPGDPDTYCCLGVAGWVLDAKAWIPPQATYPSARYAWGDSTQYLDSVATEALGIGLFGQRPFARMNDTDSLSFVDIALLLEKELERKTGVVAP